MDDVIDCTVSGYSLRAARLKAGDTSDTTGGQGGTGTLSAGPSLLRTESRRRGVSIKQAVGSVDVQAAKEAGLSDHASRRTTRTFSFGILGPRSKWLNNILAG